jgi:V/A-type H+-transporting ATPase subunit E
MIVMAQMLGDMDRLFDTLDQETQLKAKEIRDQAEQESERIINEAKKEAESIRHQILEKAEHTANRKQTELRAQMAHKEKKEQLEIREELLDQVWTRAEEMLHSLVQSNEYLKVLHQLTQYGLEILGPGEYQIAADPQGHALLTKDRLQAWSAEWNKSHDEQVTLHKRPQPANTWGGLLLEDQNQPRQVDLTMATRLENARVEISEEVYRQLLDNHE